MDGLPEVTDDTFAITVLRAPIPVLVAFYAPWCYSSNAIAPLLEDLAEEYADRVMTVKADATDNQESMRDYQVATTPVFVVFFRGEDVMIAVGGREAVLKSAFKEAAALREPSKDLPGEEEAPEEAKEDDNENWDSSWDDV
jgi:thioredoxin 1